MATKKKAKAKAKAKPAPKAKSGLAEHPVLVGFTHKEHARLTRAAKKAELTIRKFIHTATLSATSEVL